ncbi:twin transmembrane helix small protein [Ketogulonicigenium vulgare]|uniref:HIG1 domain-containing protein n=1 Tax=Ketogulonicigenium vulgare (strain WSH-001) TaxID=759362 RepID=F9Y5N8_KETVW|nr:twin transmembrane helix small protein [Ketogulonicigenium vulgare]ADO43694.1 conserved hypothetical protein [Ketogulonicigenium vulgare Y25]AEM41963.1 hypothetical protein KVU_2124 [Ketogulonicigenium vulgare WSH-001]ALJ82424.1 hypothetical protein KVH_13355 [Ketogulonicigenium vulgare]ANW35208.1 hypothetical protein KvSKV_13265 [Ketogulonicigenium vulgare]AOZ55728.1 hypothetical protein KVC_2726 [Ketogulonicigenium vulgare]
MLVNFLFVLMCISMLATLAVLLLGMGSFAKRGEFYQRNANRLMRWRIGLQAVSVIFFFAYLAARGL